MLQPEWQFSGFTYDKYDTIHTLAALMVVLLMVTLSVEEGEVCI